MLHPLAHGPCANRCLAASPSPLHSCVALWSDVPGLIHEGSLPAQLTSQLFECICYTFNNCNRYSCQSGKVSQAIHLYKLFWTVHSIPVHVIDVRIDMRGRQKLYYDIEWVAYEVLRQQLAMPGPKTAQKQMALLTSCWHHHIAWAGSNAQAAC